MNTGIPGNCKRPEYIFTKESFMKRKRRDFIKKISGIGLGLSGLPYAGFAKASGKSKRHKTNRIEEICVFSKHLQFLDYNQMAETAAEIGFAGVDLSVRPGGHVLPENVARDLPIAVKAVEKAGLKVPMMTTAITSASDFDSQAVLGIAANEGIKLYRMGYMKYDFERGIDKTLDDKKFVIDKLVELNKFFGIIGDYQNHDGTNIGAALWDLWTLFRNHDTEWIGVQYDIRHNTVEGGHSWPVDLQLVSPYIHSLVIKDFKWGIVNGKWRTINTPIGEGMVDFPRFFKMIKELNIGGPITMHFEYPLTDKTIEEIDPEEATRQVSAYMKKDLEMLKKYLSEADLY
jgi:sugar phosphate isomerase/epimerase